jgi:hypothetical protein
VRGRDSRGGGRCWFGVGDVRNVARRIAGVSSWILVPWKSIGWLRRRGVVLHVIDDEVGAAHGREYHDCADVWLRDHCGTVLESTNAVDDNCKCKVRSQF